MSIAPLLPTDDRPGECECEFTPYPPGAKEDDEESWHYLRRCAVCDAFWWSLHCPHDGHQRPCPNGHVNAPRRTMTDDRKRPPVVDLDEVRAFMGKPGWCDCEQVRRYCHAALDDLAATRRERDEVRSQVADHRADVLRAMAERDQARAERDALGAAGMRDLAAATRRAEEAEAGAAALMEALLLVVDDCECVVAYAAARALDATPAGRSLLAEVEALREVAEGAREWLDLLDNASSADEIDNSRCRAALATLDRLRKEGP